MEHVANIFSFFLIDKIVQFQCFFTDVFHFVWHSVQISISSWSDWNRCQKLISGIDRLLIRRRVMVVHDVVMVLVLLLLLQMVQTVGRGCCWGPRVKQTKLKLSNSYMKTIAMPFYNFKIEGQFHKPTGVRCKCTGRQFGTKQFNRMVCNLLLLNWPKIYEARFICCKTKVATLWMWIS